jgi:hypothetical protein
LISTGFIISFFGSSFLGIGLFTTGVGVGLD